MTIKEAIKSYPPEKKLKIGSLQSYFYIGTVGDFRQRQAEISGILYQKLQDWTEKKKNVYETRLKRPPSIEKFVHQQELRSRDFSVDAYLEYLNLWLAGARDLLSAVERSQQREARFKPLSKRQVRDVYEADEVVDPDCLVVIIDGDDLGAYWFTSDDKPGSVAVGTPHEEQRDEQ